MNSLLSFHQALSDPTRLLCLLLMHQHGELCVCDLQQALALSQPKISRHLAELKKRELVQTAKRGRWVYYRLSEQGQHWKSSILTICVEQAKVELNQANHRLNSDSGTICS